MNTNTETNITRYAVVSRHHYYPGTYGAPVDTVTAVFDTLAKARQMVADYAASGDGGAVYLSHGQYGETDLEIRPVVDEIEDGALWDAADRAGCEHAAGKAAVAWCAEIDNESSGGNDEYISIDSGTALSRWTDVCHNDNCLAHVAAVIKAETGLDLLGSATDDTIYLLGDCIA